MTPYACLISSTFLTPPPLPHGCGFLPTVYPDRSKNVLDSVLRPGLHAVTESGYAGPSVYDPAACDALAVYLLSNGVRDCVVDWEASDSPQNNSVLVKVVKRLRNKGLSPDLYGVSPTLNALTRDLHPVWAPFTTDHDLFIRTRQKELLKLRRHNPGRKIVGWLYTTFGQSGDGNPVPTGEFIGADAMSLYLRELFGPDRCDAVVWWCAMAADGNWRQPTDLPEGWDVFSSFAAETTAGN